MTKKPFDQDENPFSGQGTNAFSGQGAQAFLDMMAEAVTNGMGLASGVAREARSFTDAQVAWFVQEFQLVRREDLEAMKKELAQLSARVQRLETPPEEDTRKTP